MRLKQVLLWAHHAPAALSGFMRGPRHGRGGACRRWWSEGIGQRGCPASPLCRGGLQTSESLSRSGELGLVDPGLCPSFSVGLVQLLYGRPQHVCTADWAVEGLLLPGHQPLGNALPVEEVLARNLNDLFIRHILCPAQRALILPAVLFDSWIPRLPPQALKEQAAGPALQGSHLALDDASSVPRLGAAPSLLDVHFCVLFEELEVDPLGVAAGQEQEDRLNHNDGQSAYYQGL
mmetsp:Transcript_88709/g.185455  ORF Transcript_88709/g.185455 Transcript_88709/m.185455 type:complete len:234 (-) Transcript_88709:839-1540(-)